MTPRYEGRLFLRNDLRRRWADYFANQSLEATRVGRPQLAAQLQRWASPDTPPLAGALYEFPD